MAILIPKHCFRISADGALLPLAGGQMLEGFLKLRFQRQHLLLAGGLALRFSGRFTLQSAKALPFSLQGLFQLPILNKYLTSLSVLSALPQNII